MTLQEALKRDLPYKYPDMDEWYQPKARTSWMLDEIMRDDWEAKPERIVIGDVQFACSPCDSGITRVVAISLSCDLRGLLGKRGKLTFEVSDE